MQAPGAVVPGFRLLRLPLAAGSSLSRSLLVKRHEARDPKEREAAPRTLFVTHLDQFVTEPQLSKCFSTFGAVDTVDLKSVEKKAPRAELRADHVRLHVIFARVIFREVASLEKALAAATGRIVGAATLPLPTSELKAQLKRTVYRDSGELQKEVDLWMANYDAREEEKKKAARENAVDEDGFTKVVSGITRTEDGFAIRSASRPALKTGAFAEPINRIHETPAAPGKKKKRKGGETSPDFYRFQLREKKREEIVEHRKRKAEDIEKVDRMKKSRKFEYMGQPSR